MRRRTRKFIGALVMVGFVTVYALIAMAVAQGNAVRHASGYVQAAFYVICGMAWILPMMPLIRWMERPDGP